jgi:hypothetical protein
MPNMGDLVETDLRIGAGSSGLAMAAGAGTAASSGLFRPLDQAGIPWRRIIDNRTGKNGRHWHDGIVPPVRLRSPWWLRRP